MKSVMSHQFSQIPSVKMERSVFDRSHGHKTTFNSGDLIPFYCDEMLPGDTFDAKTTIFARLATPIFPIMDNIFLETFFFFVPNRLVWEHWQKFNGAQDHVYSPGDYVVAESFAVPVVTVPTGGWQANSLEDHFGIPVGNVGAYNAAQPAAFWHRAYNLIWNEWFRPQDLCNPVTVPIDDGPDDPTFYSILKRAKRHDYFTSCLPWPQKGPSVQVPLGSRANVYGDGKSLGLNDAAGSFGFKVYATGAQNEIVGDTNLYNVPMGTVDPTAGISMNVNRAIGVVTSGESGLYADLSTATAATINQLRQSFQIQKLYERDARGGTRYTEIIRSHFGVTSPDSRQQRPEYLGGGSTRINIHPVQQTSSTGLANDGSGLQTPQGNLAGYGVCAANNMGFKYSATEHGVLIGLVNVRADISYQQGMPRMFSRRTRWDFYWPALAHLGEQAVYNKEIYVQGTVDDGLVFGYQERWAEYRYFPATITAEFRSSFGQTLDSWHLAEHFATLPALNPTFILEPPPIDRVIAVSERVGPQIIFDSYMSLHCARPMPVYSVPGLIDHF